MTPLFHKEMESPILGRETKEWMKRHDKYFSPYSFTEYLAEYMSLKLNRDAEYRSKFLCKKRFDIK
jgi:hypothetical protein